jgi:hypothetical protein
MIPEITMENHRVVSHEEWLAARRQLLAEEKEFTRLRDRLSQQRRDLPYGMDIALLAMTPQKAVIATSPRVGAMRRPRTGSTTKQSRRDAR